MEKIEKTIFEILKLRYEMENKTFSVNEKNSILQIIKEKSSRILFLDNFLSYFIRK